MSNTFSIKTAIVTVAAAAGLLTAAAPATSQAQGIIVDARIGHGGGYYDRAAYYDWHADYDRYHRGGWSRDGLWVDVYGFWHARDGRWRDFDGRWHDRDDYSWRDRGHWDHGPRDDRGGDWGRGRDHGRW